MAAGLALHVWTIAELVEVALGAEPCEPPSPEPLKPRPEASKATERQTSTGARLRIDVGKTPPKQTTIWTALNEAKMRDGERGKPPLDEEPKPSA